MRNLDFWGVVFGLFLLPLAGCAEGVQSPDWDDEGGASGTGQPGGTGGTGAGASGPGGTGTAPCNVADPGCVVCGSNTCASPDVCCGVGDGRACTTTSQCDSDVVLGCDGAEDCAGASCCVTLYSTPAGLDSAGTSCVSSCEKRSSTTGSGVIVDSVACRSSGDCAEVLGEQGVPYNKCCWVQGLIVPACVSETYAQVITSDLGGGCF